MLFKVVVLMLAARTNLFIRHKKKGVLKISTTIFTTKQPLFRKNF